MLTLIAEDLARYVEDHSAPEPALLARLREETHASLPDPQMQVGRVEGAFLRLLVAIAGAERVLEIGTFSGYSALCMAEALPAAGRLVTCDIDPAALAVARKYFELSPHGAKIEIREGPALATIAALAQANARFDLVFIDADKEGYEGYFEAVLPLLPSGGLVVADNALWSGRVVAPQSESDRALARFNDRVASDSRVDNVLLSIRDGIMLARKK